MPLLSYKTRTPSHLQTSIGERTCGWSVLGAIIISGGGGRDEYQKGEINHGPSDRGWGKKEIWQPLMGEVGGGSIKKIKKKIKNSYILP